MQTAGLFPVVTDLARKFQFSCQIPLKIAISQPQEREIVRLGGL
jgi:hypothetical protein